LNKDEKRQRYFGTRNYFIQKDMLDQHCWYKKKFDTGRYFGARKSLIQEDILVQEICQYEKKKIFWYKKYEDKKQI